MTLQLPPNMEALVSDFLRQQAEVSALVADRVYTAIPAAPTWPLVRVTQLLDVPTGAPLWGIAYTIQVEAFGGSKGDAWRIAQTCRAAIDARLAGNYTAHGAVVSGSKPGGLVDLPDDSLTPAKPRWLFSSTIYARPGATVAP